MRFDRHITRSRIIEIESPDLAGAIRELLQVALARVKDAPPLEQVAEQLLAREKTMTTYLGNGVALPHTRLPLKRPYIIAIGRVRHGLDFEGQGEYREVRLLCLLLASDSERSYLNVLSSIARLYRDAAFVDHLASAPTTVALQDRVLQGLSGVQGKRDRRHSRFNRVLLREAEKIARQSRSAAILLFGDTFTGGVEITDALPRYRTILVTASASDSRYDEDKIETAIEVRAYSRQRLSQARSAILIGLTRGLFKYSDRLCCVGGLPGSNQIDTIIVVDVEREFQSVIERENNLLPKAVKVEVVERLIAVATELAVEGREGRPVGTLFVLGDTERVNTMIKPLVLNPFYGYREEDRNVLNPFMDETLKEFSVIDGCFVIRGNGVIESAGSLIHTPSEFYEDLPSGFGARHSAAAAISRAADCLAICISASSGQVTLFRKGVMLPILEKPLGPNR